MWSILINCFLLFIALERVHSSKPSLKFVFVTTRGGEHQPCIYPGGPNFDDIKIDEKQSHLTEEGKETAYELGQNLSKTYKSQLGITEWSDKNCWSFAGKATRNQEAALILKYSFQNKEEKTKQWTQEELSKAQFPSIDYFFKFLNKNECPAFWNEFMTQMTSDIKTLQEEYKSSLTEVKQNYKKIDTNNPAHIWITYETVQRLKHNGRTPNWWTTTIESDLKAYSEKFLHAALTKTEKLTKLSGGPMLTDILKDMDEIKKGKKQPVSNIEKGVSIFTASQSVLAAQLAAFSPKGTKLGDKEISDEIFYPGIGATHVLELYKDGNQWNVKMKYHNGDKNYKTMKLPGCQEMCPFEKFTKTLEKVKLTQNDQKNQCQSK
ncbi:testicular acid phosphatase homolog [Ctenocephalides felis]|uniref:testicular acid phosphatase homolog n=1 Tax=Ctenocephalides felis TaxID=7515 RepID=UPI000E6E2517|nr:testicular acid phosphatase homolog [Ctenocephalides felis]